MNKAEELLKEMGEKEKDEGFKPVVDKRSLEILQDKSNLLIRHMKELQDDIKGGEKIVASGIGSILSTSLERLASMANSVGHKELNKVLSNARKLLKG